MSNHLDPVSFHSGNQQDATNVDDAKYWATIAQTAAATAGSGAALAQQYADQAAASAAAAANYAFDTTIDWTMSGIWTFTNRVDVANNTLRLDRRNGGGGEMLQIYVDTQLADRNVVNVMDNGGVTRFREKLAVAGNDYLVAYANDDGLGEQALLRYRKTGLRHSINGVNFFKVLDEGNDFAPAGDWNFAQPVSGADPVDAQDFITKAYYELTGGAGFDPSLPQTITGLWNFSTPCTIGGTAIILEGDARLTDARTPLAHTHVVADITDIAANYAPLVHTHTVSQITDIAANYAAIDHTHPGIGAGATNWTGQDLDTLDGGTDNGFYRWAGTAPTNAPFTYAGLIHIYDGAQPIQMAFGQNGPSRLAIRRKAGGTWNTWTEFAQLADPNFTGTVDMAGDLDVVGSIGTRYGIDGDYSGQSGNTAYGATIWAMDSNWRGLASGNSYAPTGLYGICWMRSTNANADAGVGEGLYLYQNGSLMAAFGLLGARVRNLDPLLHNNYTVGNSSRYFSAAYIGEVNISSTDTTITRKAAGQLGVEGCGVFSHASSSYGSAKVTFSTSAASGGSDGDVWFQYT